MRLVRLFSLLFLASATSLSALEIFVNRSYTSTEKAQATLYASGEGTLFLRLYRIDNVHDYLSGQNNAHTVVEKNERLMQPGYFLWRSVIENFEYSLYQFARRYMRSDYRNRLRNDLGLEKYAFPFRDRFPETNLFSPLALPIVTEVAIPVRARHWQALKHQFGDLKPGYYLIEASQGRHIAHSPLVVSDLAMVAKTSPYNVLIYAVNLTTGQPVDNATVTAYVREKVNDAEVHVPKQTFTLKDGIAFSEKTGYLKDSQNTLYVIQSGKHFAFSDLYAMDAAKNLYEAAIYSDRPVYRIGDTVQVRAVFVRKQAGAAHGKVKYQIKSGDEVIHSGEADLSPAGSLCFSYKTQTLKPGRFTIPMELGGETHIGSFLIEQYKKPETRATMAAEKPVILRGETAVTEVTAAYYSGEALSKAPVEVTIERQRISYPWWYGFGYDEYYGDADDNGGWEFVKEYQGELDAKGKLKFPVSTDGKDNEVLHEADFTYRIRASVKAQNREETQASVRFKVYRAPVSLRISQERWYFTATTPIAFKVLATSVYDSKPAKTGIKADLVFREYDAKGQKYTDVPVTSLTLNTNEVGEISAEFPAQKKAGVYFVKVSASQSGRGTSEMLETYVYGGSEFYGDSGETIERPVNISANKKQYELFETAEFAVRMPVQKKLPVLLTIENDRIRKYVLLKDADPSFIYKEELKSDISPNFEISVTALDFDKNPRFYSGQAQVVLPPKHRIMKLEVVSDRDRYRPGEEANIVVKAFDYKNNPISVEYSLGVVDEAIYAIREDSLKSLPLVLNPKLPSSVVTHNSLAFTFYGYGTEKSLYALYREQMAEAAALRKGEMQKVKIRKNFKDTAYFTATGKTGADGIGKLRIPLPDNLTEWRITTHAHSSAGLSGSERTKLVVAKDFAMRLAQPRFLRERDEAKLRLLVSNQLKEKQTASFETTLDSLKLDKAFPAKLEIPAGEERYVDFTVTAPFYPADGKATLKFIARAEKDNDGLEMTLPILPYGVENFVAEQKIFGDDEKNWSTKLALDRDARQELAELTVSFIPGVVPSILETLPYLIQYPYGCVEQTLSTFLPGIWASKAAEKLKLPLPVKATQLKDITDQGLKKLYGYQHGDGGWGWWSDDPTDIYMTSYTLWGLNEAAIAGIAVDKKAIARGVKYLTEQLTLQTLKDLKDSYSIHRLLFAQGVAVTLAKKTPVADKIKAEWTQLLEKGFNEPAGLALIVQGAAQAKWKDLRNTALAKLVALKKSNAQGAYFEHPNKTGYYWYSDREETTAQVLNALLAADVKQANLSERELVSYLITQKKQRRWRSTKLSALITKAFAEYAAKTGEKLSTVKVAAEVDGARRDAEYNPKKPNAQDLQLTFKTNSRELKVKVNRSGSGFFLARAEWKHYLNKPLIVPREGSFKVARKFFAVNKNQNQYSKGEAKYTFKPGELVMTEIDLKADKGSEYLLLEDMIPAGFEPLNSNELADMGTLRYDNYANSPASTTRLDDRVGLAKTQIVKENFTPRSFYRAVFPGKYQTMPAQGGLMYYPETFAYSASDVVTISE
jgi:alpha-2-macroglobulin